MRSTLTAVACAAVVTVPAAVIAQGTIVETPVGENIVAIGRASTDATIYTTLAQTFVAPGGMRYLQDFTVFLTEGFGGAHVGLRAYVYNFAGTPAGSALTGPALFQSATFAGSANLFGFDAYRFSTGNTALVAGATYAFVLSASEPFATTPDGSTTFAGATLADAYAGGTLYAANTGANFSTLGDAGAFTPVTGAADLSFRATFTATAVTTNVVPEPGPLALVGIGLVLVVGSDRRRQRARANTEKRRRGSRSYSFQVYTLRGGDR